MITKLELKPQDMWIGAYWKKTYLVDVAVGSEARVSADSYDDLTKLFGARPVNPRCQHDLWVCVVPCLPIHLTWFTGV